MKFSLIVFALTLAVSLELVCAGKLRRYRRVVNGNRAVLKQFPYQVGLRIYKNTPGTSWCGGAIISESWILTAAHCIDEESINGVRLYLGALDITNNTEIGQQRLFIPRKYFHLHELYSEELLLNDIALIRLPAPLQFDDYIKSVQLPRNRTESFAGNLAIATGWGQTDHFDTDSDTNRLYYVSLPVVSNAYCSKKWHQSKDNSLSYFTSTFLCVDTTGNHGTSYGDSGGPLVVKDKKYGRTIVGLVSFGEGSESEVPEFYTRVSMYLDWIASKMQKYA